MAQSYKVLKENFVSGHTGGGIWEINAVTAVASSAYLLWAALQSKHGLFAKYGPAAIIIDFLLNVIAILLAITFYSPFPFALNASLTIPAVALLFSPQRWRAQRRALRPPTANGRQPGAREQEPLSTLPVRPFITAYRGSMLVVTCVAILAVDFKVFPRRFAKVETWGTSLMDMGVGSFVFTAGLVAARPMLASSPNRTATTPSRHLIASTKHSLPLLVLGLIRLYSVKGLDYAEHVTEYGVHWNFFFTLALLPPFVALFDLLPAMTPNTFTLLSLATVIPYQVVLESTDLKAYVLTAPRINLFSQNREGVFSISGYLAIFVAGKALGLQILPRRTTGDPTNHEDLTRIRSRLLGRLFFWSAFWSALFFFSTSYGYGLGLQVSRRLANLPYVVWVSAFNCFQITLFCIIETLLFPSVYRAADGESERNAVQQATPWVLKSFNRNGLAIFLAANLLTGLTNLTLNTLNMDSVKAVSILLIYSAVVTGLALMLDQFNLSIKL